MNQMEPLQAFSFDNNAYHSWKLWLKYFDCHLAVTEKDSKSGKIKTSIFLTYIGQKGREIYETSRNECLWPNKGYIMAYWAIE